VNPLARRVAELERDKRGLERRLKQAELIIDFQKKGDFVKTRRRLTPMECRYPAIRARRTALRSCMS